MKVAAHEVNVAPHHCYGHLSTVANAHFAAARSHRSPACG